MTATASVREQRERDRVPHCPVARWIGMQMIAAVIGRQQAIRLAGIPHHLVKIDHRIEVTWRANPRIDRLSIRFVRRPRMIET